HRGTSRTSVARAPPAVRALHRTRAFRAGSGVAIVRSLAGRRHASGCSFGGATDASRASSGGRKKRRLRVTASGGFESRGVIPPAPSLRADSRDRPFREERPPAPRVHPGGSAG